VTKVKYQTKSTKSILNKMKNIDGWFWCRYTLNAYNGCEHACVYCDARSDRYYLHKEFDNSIYVKENSAELLEKKLKNTRTLLPDIVALGGTCDAYQPAEAKFQNLPKILKILAKYKYPVNISTKNKLIQRDLELFNQIATDTYAGISFTITSIDPSVVNALEPGASTTQERLDVIHRIHTKFPKIHVGVNFMPIIPFRR
jgi:DNA repair photolyase